MASTTTTPPSSAASRRSWSFIDIWSAFQGLLIPVLSVVTALLASSLLLLLNGRDPVTAFEGLFEGAFLEPRGLIDTFLKMTPLVLSGLAVAFAFKSGMFNIGAQGQLIIGSITAAWIGVPREGIPPPLPVG